MNIISFVCFFRWLVIVILLTYMGIVIVILLNILIAQLSYTYSEAKKIAKLQYAADTMRIVTRLEFSRFANWVGNKTLGRGLYNTINKDIRIRNFFPLRCATLCWPPCRFASENCMPIMIIWGFASCSPVFLNNESRKGESLRINNSWEDTAVDKRG